MENAAWGTSQSFKAGVEKRGARRYIRSTVESPTNRRILCLVEHLFPSAALLKQSAFVPQLSTTDHPLCASHLSPMLSSGARTTTTWCENCTPKRCIIPHHPLLMYRRPSKDAPAEKTPHTTARLDTTTDSSRAQTSLNVPQTNIANIRQVKFRFASHAHPHTGKSLETLPKTS